MNNTRYSSSSTTTEMKPEVGAFQCCQCPLVLQINFWQPVVPEYLLTSIKKRKTGSSSALNLINRGKEASTWNPSSAYSTLFAYVRNLLNGDDRTINVGPESPFGRKVGVDADILLFMEYLGWERNEDSLSHPRWDEELQKGRLLRKRLEGVELELAVLALEAGNLPSGISLFGAKGSL